MEGDPGGEGEVSFEFNVGNDVNKLSSNYATQASPIPTYFSNNLTPSTNGNGQLLDSAENAPNLAPPLSSSSFSFPLIESPPNNNGRLSRNGDVNGESSTIPSVVDDPILELSFNPPEPPLPIFQTSPSFSPPPQAPYSLAMVEMVPQIGLVQSFPPGDGVNWMNPNQFNVQPQNGFQTEIFSAQPNQISGVGQYIATDFPQPPICQPSFPPNQPWMGDGIQPWMNRQQSNWLSLSNNTYRPLTPLRPQLPNQQQHNQVPGIEKLYDPQYPVTVIPGPSVNPTSPQQFPFQFNQSPMPPNIYDPTMMPNHFLSLRPPQFGNQYQGQAAPHELIYNSTPPMHPWNQQYSDHHHHHHHQINQAAVPPTSVNPPQQALSLLSNPPCSRPQTGQLQELPNQSIRTNPNLEAAQQSQLLNSETHHDQETRNNNTEVASLRNDKGKGIMEEGKSIFEIGDGMSIFEIEDAPSSSSSSNKRSRVELTTEENYGPAPRRQRVDWNLHFNTTQDNQEGMSSVPDLSNPRSVRNSIYDPLFEGIGLPIDPHLRMFALL